MNNKLLIKIIAGIATLSMVMIAAMPLTVKAQQSDVAATIPEEELQSLISIKDFFSFYDKFETDRLIIRKMTDEDALKIADFMVDSDMIKYLTDINYKFTDRSDPLKYILCRDSNGKKLYNNPEYERYTVVLKSDDTVIGNVVVSKDSDFSIPSVTVGYLIGKEYQNKGYCYEAVSGLLKEMFNLSELVRVNFFCMTPNTASLKVIEKLGAIPNYSARHQIEAKVKSIDKEQCSVDIIYKGSMGRSYSISKRILPKRVLGYDLSDFNGEKTFSSGDMLITYHTLYNFDKLLMFFDDTKTGDNVN